MKSPKILAVGEILWDLLPAGKQLGGAPANFTYHCLMQGADARIVTRVGDDALGRQAVELLRAAKLPVEDIQTDRERPTGTVDVALDATGQPRFTIHEGVAWDHIEATPAALDYARQARAICFGSLAQRSEVSRNAIRRIIEAARPGVSRVFDVNLRPPFVSRDVIASSLELTDVFKLNDAELPELAAMFGLPSGERAGIEALATRWGLGLVALTRGAQGSLLWADGAWSDDAGQAVAVVDTVGAGDAFTAALLVGRLAGAPLEAIHRHASAVAAFVCTQNGAMPNLPRSLRSPSWTEGS